MNTTTSTLDKQQTLAGHGRAVLEEAGKIVSTDRNRAYGHPRDNFERTGLMWDAILDAADYRPGGGIPPRLVGLMMICLKLDREAHKHTDDNLVDICGYAACTAEITGTSLKDAQRDAA